MNLDFTSLECFLAVYETKSFSKAAKKLNRTQSAVSQKIGHLENFLSTKLFFRDSKISLTGTGKKLLPYANSMIKLNQEIIDSFKEPELAGNLRFGVPEDFATFYLSNALAEFTKMHPMIKLHIECDLTLNLLDKFKKGKFDLILLKTANKDYLANSFNIWKEKLVWVGTDTNYDYKENKVVNLVLSPEPCVYRKRALEALKKQKLKTDIVFSSQSYINSIAAVKAGLGITVLPKNMVPEGLQIIKSLKLPNLKDTHATLLIKDNSFKPSVSFSEFIIKQLNSRVTI